VKRQFAAVVLFAIACAKPEGPKPPAPPVEETVADTAERMSICDVARGGTIVSRTGEAVLDISAMQTIDGDPGSFWMTPLHDLPQSITIALPARARIEKVGIRTTAKGGFGANHVTFETSIDGRAFSPVASITSKATEDAQWVDVSPVEASFVRVTIVDSSVPNHDVRLHAILVRGTELEPARSADITGCWNINGELARFERKGQHVIGVLQTGKAPIRFDGGFDGRLYRLSWVRGNDYGMALITLSPDGQHLSGLNWHEEAIPMFFDVSFFGERAQCKLELSQPAASILERTGRLSLYGRTELPPLSPKMPQFRFVAHEFRYPTAKENHDAAERALDPWRKLNVPCIAAGSDNPRQNPVTDAMRALYSTVDLEIRR
jgi:F5/8 type C domain-containing protein